MFQEDRVLVGVVNRKRDLEIILNEGWYRVPVKRMPRGVNAEYIAFFLSGAFKERNGAVHYFAECRGVELVRRRDILPKEKNHPRANEQYYKVQLGLIETKDPPVENTTKRSLSFVYTTWDRFVHAKTILDLYSESDKYVDRVYYTLSEAGLKYDRSWQQEYRDLPRTFDRDYIDSIEEVPPVFYTDPNTGFTLIDRPTPTPYVQKIIDWLLQQDGPVDIHLPLDNLL
ncbi:MAG: hypothetical protein J0M33_11970 [Anaerolineae bacterium]|nr:hypothetical protein [Anaerolineae bacterium]